MPAHDEISKCCVELAEDGAGGSEEAKSQYAMHHENPT